VDTSATPHSPEDELSRAYREAALLLCPAAPLVDLVTAVGHAMGLQADQLRRLEFGGLLHDVGKAGIPREILDKPGALEPHERAVIEQHTTVGQALLEKMGGLLGEVGQVVRSSHERYDGLGYPDGLVGDAIPIESRIIGCCDALSAMTTNRPHREALTVDEALKRLRRNSGTQFDPDVVDALLVVTAAGSARPANGIAA
jgi:HD-GYP domain-containing protein (c-di-GMP phosphodiesterase class II)